MKENPFLNKSSSMIEFYRNIDKNFNKSSQILSISWGHFLLKIENLQADFIQKHLSESLHLNPRRLNTLHKRCFTNLFHFINIPSTKVSNGWAIDFQMLLRIPKFSLYYNRFAHSSTIFHHSLLPFFSRLLILSQTSNVLICPI